MNDKLQEVQKLAKNIGVLYTQAKQKGLSVYLSNRQMSLIREFKALEIKT